MAFPEPVDEVIAYFLTEYDVNSRPQFLKKCIELFLAKKYTAKYISLITDKFLTQITKILMEEYDERQKTKQLLRYEFLDSDGTKIKGIGQKHTAHLRVFQNALNNISDTEFEQLSAVILKSMGCYDVWVTPASHDQGLDAFGYSRELEKYLPSNSKCIVVMLAQAKHYNKTKVGTRDIREFIGSVDLAIHEIFSSVDNKYDDLVIKPFGPTVLVFLTSQEVPQTVKRLATKAGLVVFTSVDIYNIFQKRAIMGRKRWLERNVVRELRKLARVVVTAS